MIRKLKDGFLSLSHFVSANLKIEKTNSAGIK